MWLTFLTMWIDFQRQKYPKVFFLSPGQICAHSIVLPNQRWHCCRCCALWIQMSPNGLPLRCTDWIQVYCAMCTRPSLTASLKDTFAFLALQRLERHRLFSKKLEIRASLVVQWLRIHQPMQRMRVQALVREDPTCHGATKPVCHNYWACTLELASHNYRSPRA